MNQFLEENPTETIILTIDSGRGRGIPYNNVKRAVQIFDKLVADMSINYDKNLTIGPARGKIINITYKTNEFTYDGNQYFIVTVI